MMNQFTTGDSQTVARKKIRKKISIHCKKILKAKNIFYVPEVFFGPKWHSLHIDPRHPCLRRDGVQ
jgi:hypothetical protein